MKKLSTEKILTITTVIVILAAWYIITATGAFSETIIPSPRSVLESFVDVTKNGYKGHSLLEHLGTSMKRLMIAYGLVVVTAVPLGLLSGYNSKVRAVLEPIVEFYRPLPPLAYYTILVLWMGIDESSKLALLYLAGFAPVYIACVSGVVRIKEDYINGAKTLGAGKRQIFFTLFFPRRFPMYLRDCVQRWEWNIPPLSLRKWWRLQQEWAGLFLTQATICEAIPCSWE